MNLLHDAPAWAQFLLMAILLIAAVQDWRQRRISNWLCLAVIILAVAAAIALGPRLSLWHNASIFAVLLAVGLTLFGAGWLGGGDVKLLAALGLWSNFSTILPLLACILIAGGLVAALSLVVHGGRAARKSQGVPYAIAIAIGTAIVLVRPGLFDPPRADPLDLGAAKDAATR